MYPNKQTLKLPGINKQRGSILPSSDNNTNSPSSSSSSSLNITNNNINNNANISNNNNNNNGISNGNNNNNNVVTSINAKQELPPLLKKGTYPCFLDFSSSQYNLENDDFLASCPNIVKELDLSNNSIIQLDNLQVFLFFLDLNFIFLFTFYI